MAYTIKDIAKAAGVSVATVSRALNNSSLIKKETMDKVKAAAEKYNYIPNSFAKSLVLNKSFNIGLFFTTFDPGLTSNYFYELSLTVEKMIKEKYHLVIRSINDYKDFSTITSKLFAGIIIVTQTDKDDLFIKHLMKEEIPTVIINRVLKNIKIDTFHSDERDAVRKLINYFVKMGHRKIAIVKGKKGTVSASERYKGYIDALKENNISLSKDLIVEGNYSLASGYEAMGKILNIKGDKPTAVFFSNDDMAFGGAKLIKEKEMTVPGDFSIAGFDNTKYSEYMSPGLTTINRPVEVILKDATQRLLEKINDSTIDSTITKCVESQIIIRSSIAKK